MPLFQRVAGARQTFWAALQAIDAAMAADPLYEQTRRLAALERRVDLLERAVARHSGTPLPPG